MVSPEKVTPEPLHGTQGGIRSKPPTKAYHEGWERIFGKKKRKPRKRRKAR